jgi:hypothetical protein
MPAGLPYFAWIDATETTFAPEHMRWDEDVFSFSLKQDEGDPASLTLVVRRPRNVAGDPIGLLGPGRKIWCWFAFDCGPDLIRFRGRLVGVPTSIFDERVTLEFVARPIDLVAQKETLAETLRVLPYYDEVVIDPARRTDPEVVLEGYSAIWHYDRETHVLTVSDEITGEDGLVEFDGASEDGKVLYDGLGLTLTSGPLARVDVNAEYTWTQLAQGNVDLTEYLIKNGPSQYAIRGAIASYTLTADSWPKNGAGIGDGWTVAEGKCYEAYDLTPISYSSSGEAITKWPDGGVVTVKRSQSRSGVPFKPPGSVLFGTSLHHDIKTAYAKDGDGNSYVSSFSDDYSQTGGFVPLHHIFPTLVAGYKAGRQCTERVSFSLFADVQPVLTDPEDGEALRIDDIKSVNLSETIGEGTDAYVPIGDPRRRSYIATDRGNRSLEHLIALARAHLLKQARVVEIALAPKLARMPEITLRKNAFLVEPRVGEALGKIIGYSLALDGSDGRVKCEVRIGCTIGRGGSAVAAGGDPTYCEIAYAGADYQQFTGRMVLFDSSVAYQPPSANPNDDGIDFLSNLTADDVIDIPLVVQNPPEEQVLYISGAGQWEQSVNTDLDEAAAAFAAASSGANQVLQQHETKLIFKLKSMSRQFTSDYELQVTDLKIPTGYNLEAV